jgi:hypothetical protein
VWQSPVKVFSIKSRYSVNEPFTCVNNVGFIREASLGILVHYGRIVDETESCCLFQKLVGVVEIDDTATVWLVVRARGLCDDFFCPAVF